VSVLLITYTLNNQNKDYTSLFEGIKSNCNYWWHYFDTTWIVSTTRGASEYAKLLYPHIETTDRLLVVRITKEHQGWLPKDAWNWLNERIY
jgi:hypothetical protein